MSHLEPPNQPNPALHFIVIFGGELFTGTIMIFGVGKSSPTSPVAYANVKQLEAG